jgi:DNA-binding Lrp family transcriptional regulator
VEHADTTETDLAIPRRTEDLGIPVSLVHDLVLRQSLYDGRTSTVRLADKLRLSPMLLTGIVEELRELRLIEIQGLDGRDYRLALTEAGRQQANDRMQLCRYAGAAPVSLDAYTSVVARQHANPTIDFDALKAAFSDLVIEDDLLWELGPAAIAGGAIFLYGPPGTGKSSIAERLLRIYDDKVLVPYALEVDGQIVTVFDPIIHRPVPDQPSDLDPRWVLCDRPSIIVGGELVGSMLDLQYQADSGIYLAPLQMQANNGILVIDDFGRQASLTPQQLLNRWIVPLDRQIDYLSLDYGMKFEIPFDAKIVFSTNLSPDVLGDEAFFRRIQSKILIPTIDDDQFDEVLRRVASAMKVELAPGASAHLRDVSKNKGDGDLRPYLPGAVCKILKSICAFAKLPIVLDDDMIDRVASVYFTHAAGREGGGKAPSLSSLKALADAAATRAPQPPAEEPAAAEPMRPSPVWNPPEREAAASPPSTTSRARVDQFLSAPPPGGGAAPAPAPARRAPAPEPAPPARRPSAAEPEPAPPTAPARRPPAPEPAPASAPAGPAWAVTAAPIAADEPRRPAQPGPAREEPERASAGSSR